MDEKPYSAYPKYPNEDDAPGRTIDLDLIREVWRRRRSVGILVFGGVLACALTVAMSLPSLYRASAKVLVDRQEVSETFVRPSVTGELEPRIQTIHQQVTSRERLADLITKLNLYPEERKHAPMEGVVEQMRRDIDLQLQGLEANGRNATVSFSVSYRGRDPQTTATVANTLAAYYVEENSKGRRRQAARTAAFLSKQVTALKEELDQHDVRTGDYVRRHTSDLPQQLGVNESAVSRLSSRLQANADLQLRQIDRRERLQKELNDAAMAPQLAATTSAESDLSRMKQDLAALKNRYSDRYPDVARLSAEVAAREQQLTARTAAAKNLQPAAKSPDNAAAFTEIDGQLQALRSEEAALRRAIGTYESRLASTPTRQMELERMSRGSETTRERYQLLLKEYEDARIAASLEQGEGAEEFRVLDRALPPREPLAPNRAWLLLVGVGAALVAGVVAMVLFEKLDTSFHAPDDLRGFVDTPILATIPRVLTTMDSRRRRFRRAVAASAAVLVFTLLAAGSWYFASGNELITRLTTRGV